MAKPFFDDASKKAVRSAVERVESQTSAELVVAVRRQAGLSYLGTDLAFGAVVAMASLLALLFVEREFATAWIPIDVALSFALGVIVCRNVPPLRRFLALSSRRSEETRRAAARAFCDLGIGRTSGRSGILVFVGMFERQVAVIPDVGVDPSLIRSQMTALSAAVGRESPSFDAFVAALDALGPALGPALPRSADDVNELPDEVA